MSALKKAAELGKEAAKLVAKSVRISVCQPDAKNKQHQALHADKAYNSGGPWRQGRKSPKRNKK